MQQRQRTLNGTINSTPTCSSLSGIASHETYVAGQEESGCLFSIICESSYIIFIPIIWIFSPKLIYTSLSGLWRTVDI